MKIGIYCGVDVGNVRDLTLDYIGVDRGVSHLLKQNITPIIALGDMDSIEDITLLNGLDVYQVLKMILILLWLLNMRLRRAMMRLICMV